MPKMRVRKVKRKCNVLGCKCTDTYALTATSEYGSSVVACKNCLAEALKCIEEGRIEGLSAAKETERVIGKAEQGNVTATSGAEEVTTKESEGRSDVAKTEKASYAKSKKGK